MILRSVKTLLQLVSLLISFLLLEKRHWDCFSVINDKLEPFKQQGVLWSPINNVKRYIYIVFRNVLFHGVSIFCTYEICFVESKCSSSILEGLLKLLVFMIETFMRSVSCGKEIALFFVYPLALLLLRYRISDLSILHSRWWGVHIITWTCNSQIW